MRYEQVGSGSMFPYPNHDVPPSEKGRDWCLQYAKAAYYDFSFSYPKGVFANSGGDYEKFRMYALGKQPNSPYKKWLGVDQQTNNTWRVNDWSIRSIVSTYRDRAISRIMEQTHGIVATPIDMLAKTELDEYYANMKAKLAVRKLIQQANQELASHPLISLESGEPMDIEELEMRIELGEQFNRSKDAELAIEVGLYENNYKQVRRGFIEDLFDYGVTGYKDWLDPQTNKAKFRKVKPDSVVCSYCRNSDFSDAVHIGEVTDVSLVDLALVQDKDGNRMFTDEQLTEFASTIAGKWGNPSMLGVRTGWLRPWDKFKCRVMDIAFFTYDDYTYTDRKTKEGNPVFRVEDYNRGSKDNKRYMKKCYRMVYQCKWIIGTDYCYDWGVMPDQKRPQDPKKKAYAELPYKLIAYNFHEMNAQGFMERLIPYLDDYQMTMLQIQNFKARVVPSGWWIDLDALENVALSKGGADMQPKELLQMFYETGVLVGRSKDAAGNPMSPNWKPVIPISNTAAGELQMFYQDLINIIQQIELLTGYNDITMGQASSKTLVPGYETGIQSTNHALYPIKYAEESLSEKLAEDVLLRMQQGIKKGGISGYANSLNTNTLKFIEISKSIALREYGITLEERTTDDQKMWLLQQMQADIQNGFLDTSDAVTLVNTKSAKQAQMIWAYKVKKNKEIMQQNEMQKIQLKNAGAQEAAMAAAQLGQQKQDMEWQYELQKEQIRIMGELKKEEMRLQAQIQMKALEMGVKQTMNTEMVEAKKDVANVTAEAKVIASSIDQEGKIAATELAGLHQQAKQEIANKKPQAPKSASK